MYFYRWFLEKVAATALDDNERTFIQGKESDVGGPPNSVIPEQSAEEIHSFQPGNDATTKAQVGELKSLSVGRINLELAPQIRGDKTPAEMQKSKVAAAPITKEQSSWRASRAKLRASRAAGRKERQARRAGLGPMGSRSRMGRVTV